MMKEFAFRTLSGLLTLLACLPLGVLYVISDFLFVLVYYIVRYRRDLVARNLAASFHDKDEKELKRIARKFYRNFTDYIVETVKLLHISDEEMSRRMVFENLDIIERHIASGRSVTVYFSHAGNWEWAPSVTLHMHHTEGRAVDFCQVYRPLRSEVFDRLMLKVRSRFGSISFPKATVFRSLFKLSREGVYTVTGFMSDQKPSHGDPTVPLMFLNRPTAFISGTETLCRRLGHAAVYWDMEKTSRGHYRIVTREICADPSTVGDGDITRRYAEMLQTTILRNPSIWLWTHNRWKIPVQLPLQ